MGGGDGGKVGEWSQGGEGEALTFRLNLDTFNHRCNALFTTLFIIFRDCRKIK